jgi:hypothetical protein
MQNFSRESLEKNTIYDTYKPKCEFNVKWILERENANWIQLAENRDLRRAVVNRVINLRVPKKTGDFLTSLTTTSFLTITLLGEVPISPPIRSKHQLYVG